MTNAYSAFTTADRRWEIALFATNLTDERYRVSGNSSTTVWQKVRSPHYVNLGAALYVRF